jgi:hypothetical protein
MAPSWRKPAGLNFMKNSAFLTQSGRFELIVLHLTVVLRRLGREPQGATLGRALVDAFGRQSALDVLIC